MQNHKRFSVVMLAGAFTFAAAVISQAVKTDPTDPPQGVSRELYYSLYLGKTKCGWAGYQLQRRDNTILTRNKLNIKLGRDNLTVEVSSDSETQETLDGKPLSFQAEQNLAGSKTTYRGEFKNGQIVMHTIQGGQTTTHKFPAPPDTTMAWGDYLQTFKHLRQTGKTFSTHTFDPQMGPGKVALTTETIVGPAVVQIAGKKISGIKIVAQSEDLGPVPVTGYFDDQGNMLATEVQLGILKLQLVASTRKEAFAGIQREEIFDNSFVRLARPLKLKPKKSLVLKISALGADPLSDVPETSMQKIIARQPESILLEIRSPGEKRFKFKDRKPTPANLACAAYTKTDDPVLIKLAGQAAGSAKDPKEVAARICLFVNKYIVDKNLSKVFDTASETARTRSGDCTEHAVLMAALARVKKIPSRIVAGLVLTDQKGPYGSFGYHMWTQVWIHNQWIDMDPTFGEVEPDPTHIALSIQDLGDENFTRQAVNLVKFIRQIKIEPVEGK